MANERHAPVRDLILVAAPTAGADWSFRNDSGERLIVDQVLGRLVTSAAVANRNVALTIATSKGTWGRYGCTAVQTTGLTRFYSAIPGGVASGDAAGAVMLAWPTEGVLLEQDDVLASVTSLIDAADQWSQVILRLRRLVPSGPDWLEPAPTLYEHDTRL